MGMEVEFGYYPASLNLTTGDLSVRTLPDLARKTADVTGSGLIERDWVYAPPAEVMDFDGGVRELPHDNRPQYDQPPRSPVDASSVSLHARYLAATFPHLRRPYDFRR